MIQKVCHVYDKLYSRIHICCELQWILIPKRWNVKSILSHWIFRHVDKSLWNHRKSLKEKQKALFKSVAKAKFRKKNVISRFQTLSTIPSFLLVVFNQPSKLDNMEGHYSIMNLLGTDVWQLQDICVFLEPYDCWHISLSIKLKRCTNIPRGIHYWKYITIFSCIYQSSGNGAVHTLLQLEKCIAHTNVKSTVFCQIS